ncbi:MAG: AbiV family abortive infection protein [Candidatus Acidiferrales bacterium]
MTPKAEKLQRSIQACLRSGKRLLEDAEWSSNRPSTGLALSLLAQEECGKAFVLALVRDEILPWTDEVRRSLSVHECKHLVTMIMEWLWTVNGIRFNELPLRNTIEEDAQHLPPDVATAMNIYRHEMIERIGGRNPQHYREWGGRARRAAQGNRDRKKQTALYVDIREDGDVASEPPTSPQVFEEEFTRATRLVEFAGDVDRNLIFARREYELFAEIFRAMFMDLSSEPENSALLEERFPSGIPGIVFVKRTITVANVVRRFGDQDETRIDH